MSRILDELLGYRSHRPFLLESGACPLKVTALYKRLRVSRLMQTAIAKKSDRDTN